MDSVLGYCQKQKKALIDLIRLMVECESPSGDEVALSNMANLLSDVVAPLGSFIIHPGGHMRCEITLPGPRKKRGQILLLAHYDTVWPAGTLPSMPFRKANGRLWGPGVLDMKAGLAQAFFAFRAIRELEIPVSRKVVLQINADEETGSQSSRHLTEKEAKRSDAVLVLEPGTGLEGKLKTSRKGIGHYYLRVAGVAAHAGIDFAVGSSAIVELARQIERIVALNGEAKGVTLNPGVIAGGTRSNVVAAEATAEIDVRAIRLKDLQTIDRKLRALKATDKRCKLEWTGGINRPPMERTKAIADLFAAASSIALDMGFTIDESASGGGSDGNFTAAVGTPTLDGLGAVGEGAHATHESILIDRIPDRTAMLARLIAAI